MREWVAFIGSRRWPERLRGRIEREIKRLPAGTVVVSGGAKGVDTWAAQYARKHGYPVVEYPVQFSNTNEFRKYDYATALYSRNQAVATAAGRAVAFVALDRKGGTEHCIKLFLAKDKQVKIIEQE